MNKICFILVAFVLFFCSSCEDDDTGFVAPGQLMSRVTAKVQDNNALRVDITVDFKEDVVYQVEYWKENEPESVCMTREREGGLGGMTTLVLLRPETVYHFRVHARSGNRYTESDVYSFTTRALPSGVPTYTLHQDELDEEIPGYIMLTRGDMQPGYITLLDTKGNVVWYENTRLGVKVATFDTVTNMIYSIIGTDPDRDYNGKEILIMDLFGNVVFHKDYEQLGKRYFHHDIRRLPDGNVVFVNYVPKEFDLTAQGGEKNETVFGDGLTIMDREGNFKWEWDCFSEINPQDDPDIMGEIFGIQLRGDWIHANCVNYDKEGYFYMSFNWLNEVWKIDPKSGKVIYRLGGKGGNISIPDEGYTHGLHSLKLLDNNKILLFENGIYTHVSRALIFTVDEVNKTATLDLNVALPYDYSSPYMSSVEWIQGDKLMFGSTFGKAVVFTDMQGNILRVIQMSHQSFRADYIPVIHY